MNSAVVNRAIRSLVWPVLKDRGFSSFTSRTAWRDRETFVDVVNFQSCNWYHAGVMGCTTFSFAINLGIHFNCVPSDYPPASRNGRPRPAEHQCHIRRRLYPQSPSLPDARNIWMVDPGGTNTEETVASAAMEVADMSDTWFPVFASEAVALAILQGPGGFPDDETMLPGGPDAPARNVTVGYLALALGDSATAAEFLGRALEQYQAFDAQNATISRHFDRMTPTHLEKAVCLLKTRTA